MKELLSTGRALSIFLLLFCSNLFAQDLDLASESPQNEFDYMDSAIFDKSEGNGGGAFSLSRFRFRLAYGVNSTSGGNRTTTNQTSYFGTEFSNSYELAAQYFFNPHNSLIFKYQRDEINFNLNTTSFIETEEKTKAYNTFAYQFMLSRIEFLIGLSQGKEHAFFATKGIIAETIKFDTSTYFFGIGSYFPVYGGIVSKVSFQYHNFSFSNPSFIGTSGVKKVFEMDFHYRGLSSFGIKLIEDIITYDANDGQRIFTLRILPYVQF